MADLPAAVAALAEHVPAEDLALAILRPALPDLDIVTAIRRDQTTPVVLVRKLPTFLGFRQDDRFVASVDLSVHVFTEDPDGDMHASIISEAIRVVLRNAWLANFRAPGIGSVRKMEVLSPPRRVPDWATASGPVQYADLPSNWHRYETRYRLAVRKPRTNPYA